MVEIGRDEIRFGSVTWGSHEKWHCVSGYVLAFVNRPVVRRFQNNLYIER